MKIKFFFPLLFFVIIYACNNTTNQEQNKETSATTENETNKIDQVKTLGTDITMQLQQALAMHLMKAVQDSNVAHALQFCSVRAYPLTDSISDFYNVEIKRASHKPRNPANTANDEELMVINNYIKLLQEGKPLAPVVKEKETRFTYYAPIRVFAPLCLKCHGQPEKDIAPEDFIVINMIYPEDQATGFHMNDLRGVWRVDMDKGNLVQ